MTILENTTGESFNVVCDVWKNSATGEAGLLTSPLEIADRRKSADLLDEDAEKLDASGSDADKQRAENLRIAAFDIRQLCDRLEKGRAEAMEATVRHEYTLVKPLFGALKQAERKARTAQGADLSILRDELLPKAVQINGQPVSVDSLPHYIADYLWHRLQKALFPSEDRQLFLSHNS